MSPIQKAIENYLVMRKALGYQLRTPSWMLRKFGAFLTREGVCHVTTDLALRWAQQTSAHSHPAYGARRLGLVRDFARYWSATDPHTEIPPMGLLPFRYSRKTPHVYTDQEIRHLIEAAQKLPPDAGLSRWTYPTIFGLLAATGLRVSEAVNLHQDDVDFENGVLTLRVTKFKKSRLVPVHPSTTDALRLYSRRRDRVHPRPITPHFFVSIRDKPISVQTVDCTFVKVSRQIGLRGLSDSFGPRLHDLRHHFAIATLMDWYRSGQNVEQRLPTLSTYLGHAHVTDTYWYLSAVPELLCLSAKRLQNRWEEL